MEEYEGAMNQYERRLGETVEEKIHTETKLANLMNFKGFKTFYNFIKHEQ